MTNDDGHLIELIAFLNQKDGPLPPDENKFDPLIRCLAHLKKANLLDGLWAGYRSFLNPLTKSYEEISFENDNIPMSFLFGPNTHKCIELYELKTNKQGDNDKKRFIATLKEVTEELSYLLLSQLLLKKYQQSISFKESVWFRDYVFNLKDRPIFILRRPTEDKLPPSTTSEHGRILLVYNNTWKRTYLNKLKCFMVDSTNVVVNKLVDSLIDSDFSIFSKLPSPGQIYKKTLNHIWDCRSLLNDFPFEFKEDDLFEQDALEKQTEECKKLLEKDGLDKTFSPDDLAKFLASTALVGEWQTNYYISTNIFEKEHQGTSYSLFFSSNDIQRSERKFIELWRLTSHLESANCISELLQKQERGAGLLDGTSDTLSAFSHEVHDASSLLFNKIIFPADSLETSSALPDKSEWLVCPVPSLFDASRNNIFIHAGGRGCVENLFQKKQGKKIALKEGLNILINKAKEIAAIRNLQKSIWEASVIAERYLEFETAKNNFQLQLVGGDEFILIVKENALALQIFVRCFLAAGANCLQHRPDGVVKVKIQINHDKDCMQVKFYNDGDTYEPKRFGTEHTLRALLRGLEPVEIGFAEKVFMGIENSKFVTRFPVPCKEWIERMENSYGTEMGSC